MKYNLSEIDIHNQDSYNLEQVNCIEKPIGIALNSYNVDYFGFFLLFHKLVLCYKIDKYYARIADLNTIERAKLVLKEEFNIELLCEPVYDNFEQILKTNLSKQNPIFVLGNMRELYYSTHYKRNDWIHCFLIYNYDHQRKLFSLIDSTQVYEEFNRYYKFTIPTKLIKEVYFSAEKNLNVKGVYYINSETASIDLPLEMIFVNFLKEICCDRNFQPFPEIDIIKEIKQGKILKEYVRKFLVLFHNKQVLYCELEKFLIKFKLPEEVVVDYKVLYEQFLATYEKIIPIISLYLHRRQYKEAIQLYSSASKNELKIFELLKLVYNLLSTRDVKSKVIDAKSNIAMFNNKNGVLTQVNDEKFKFFFDGSKIYNNWFSDESPRAIIATDLANQKKDLQFSISIESKLDKLNTLFLAGIYFKTKNGTEFIYGIHSGNSVCFEQTGINAEIINFPIEVSDQKLNLYAKGQKLCLMYDNQILIDFGEYELDSKITELGVTCKTWGEPCPIEILINCNLDETIL